nr:FlgO family outer membrane protein [Spirochaetales bacterium]
MNRLLTVLLLLLLLLGGGCLSGKSSGTVSVTSPDFFGFSDYLARQLVVNRSQGGTVKGERIILTSMVNLENLYETSAFGRTMTESLSTILFKYGFRVAEIRKTPSVFIRNQHGEMVLSRDVALLAENQAVHGVISGTYSLTPTTVIINVRLLDATSQEVLSVAGMELQRTRNINYLLTERG